MFIEVVGRSCFIIDHLHIRLCKSGHFSKYEMKVYSINTNLIMARSITFNLEEIFQMFRSHTSVIIEKGNSAQQVAVILVGTFLLSFISNLLAALYFVVCLALYKLYTQKELKRLERAAYFIEHYDWEMLRNSCSKILQYVKFTRMIELGYEIRSNTNIILHEEKEYTQSTIIKVDEDQRKIHQTALNIHTKLVQLYKKINKLIRIPICFQIQSNMEYTLPLLFRSSFELYRSLNLILNDLLIFRVKFSTYRSSPFVTSHQLKEITNFILTEFSQSLEEIEQAVKLCMSKINEVRDSVNHNDLFLILAQKQQSTEHLECLCQQLASLPQYIEGTNVNKDLQGQVSDYLCLDQGLTLPISQNDEQLNPTRNSKDVQPSVQRRQFMKKLDALLVMGLARKRQEQIQSAARQQQITQGQPALICGQGETS